MEVVSLTHYKGKSYCMELSDGNKYYLHSNIVSEFKISKGVSIDSGKLDEILSASLKRRAYERALYLLDYKDYSYVKMLEKLEENYPRDICRETADRLAECNLINDRRYAENLAEKYCNAKKYGIYRAKQEILRHGIDSELADEVLEPYNNEASENIRKIIQKKYSSVLIENPDKKNISRVTNALLRLGYRYDDAKKEIQMFIDENSSD